MSAANTCETARSRLDARRSPDPGTQPGTAGDTTHFPTPASPAAAQRAQPAEEGRARVRSGATGGAGDARPPSRGAILFPTPTRSKSSPRARGGRPRRSPDGRADVQRHCIFSGRLGVPHASFTLHFWKSCIFPLATNCPAFSGDAQIEHSPSTREQSGRPRLERIRQGCARDDTFSQIVEVLSG